MVQSDAEQSDSNTQPLLPGIQSPADLKKLGIDQLPQLAEEIRQAICDQVSKTGGHLAPNLGVVELTIAMHYVFDFSSDRLLFDVGHQCYPHKLLTGRLGLMSKLRTRQGMAGFPEPRESPYDLFSVGHAGTAISTAVGMARGDQALGQGHRKAVAIIGDASIVNGVAMEGLNNAGTLKRQFLVVLNDNGMSIAKPQGAMAQYFDRVRVNPIYDDFKKRAHEVLKRVPGGSTIEDIYHRAGEMMKSLIFDGHMFEQFGLLCIGPIDGHDIPTLIDMFNEVKDFDRPVLLHCKTVKGKGFDFASGDPTTFHSPKPFVVEGCRVELKKSGRSFTTAYADAMIDLMKQDDKIYAITAAMPDGTGLNKVGAEFPQRTLDTGICESHAMDMCAGMAKTGLKPFFTVYSTFAQRALDQVFQEVALQGLPVRVCMDRAGYVGGDGAVHHGFMDISMFRVFPGVAMLAPSDEQNLRAGLEFMRQYDEGASFVRYPRDDVPAQPLQAEVPPFVLGKANLVVPAKGEKPQLAVLAYGVMVYHAARALDELRQQGYDVAIYDARFAKPVDVELIKSLVDQQVPILTIEDHALAGGFGSAVLDECNERRISTDQIYRLGMPMKWVYQDSRNNQLAEAGLDTAGIARMVRQILDSGDAGHTSGARANEAKVGTLSMNCSPKVMTNRVGFMLAALLMAAAIGCDRQPLEPGTSETYAPGQRWTYQTRPDEPQSTILILKIDSSPAVGTIVHVRVEDVKLQNPHHRGGMQATVSHLPFAASAVDQSVRELVAQDLPLPEFRDQYEGWRDKFRSKEGTVWSQPVAVVLELIQSNLTGQPPRRELVQSPTAPPLTFPAPPKRQEATPEAAEAPEAPEVPSEPASEVPQEPAPEASTP